MLFAPPPTTAEEAGEAGLARAWSGLSMRRQCSRFASSRVPSSLLAAVRFRGFDCVSMVEVLGVGFWGLGVWGLGFGVWASEFGVEGSGLWVKSEGFMVYGSGFRV